MMRHIDAIQLRLSNERIRLAKAKTKQERKYRSMVVKQAEKELASLGISDEDRDMTDDELLSELGL